MAKKRPPTPRERALQKKLDEAVRHAVLAERTIEERTTVVEQQAREIGGLKADRNILQAGKDAAEAQRDRAEATMRAKEQQLQGYAERCHRLADSLDLAVDTVIALAPLVTPELRCRAQDIESREDEPSPYERIAMSAIAALNAWMRRDYAATQAITITPPVQFEDGRVSGDLIVSARPSLDS